MKLRKMISVIVAALLCTGLVAGLAGCNKAGAANQFTYWLAVSERSTYYRNYSDNPVYKYMSENMTFKGENGDDQKIDITFQSPPSGSEADTLKNMLATGSYPEVLDMTFGSGGSSIDDLYKDGIVLDLTDYVNEYMPNYKKFMDDNPDLVKYMTVEVDGQRRILQILNITDTVDYASQFYGICYRRDWIVSYGKDTNGENFTGSFADVNDPDSWSDNVTFPSWAQRNVEYNGSNQGMKWYADWCDDNNIVWDGTDPVTISDWEWMLDIFSKAISALSITDGYPMSLYNPGYVANGDLVCAFGGGGPTFYLDQTTGKCEFGAVGDGFKAYLTCMNEWYKKGWIDSGFMNNSDVFYQIDDDLTYNGKVGLWNGTPAILGNRAKKASEPLTQNMVVYGAAQPINDLSKYGSASERMVIPYTMYQTDKLGSGIALTSKMNDNKKDIGLLCNFIDYFYSDEGSLLKSFGLNEEQATEANNSFYKTYNLTSAYTTETIDGTTYFQRAAVLEENRDSIQTAASASKLPGITRNENVKTSYADSYMNSRTQWIRYENTGFFGSMANSLLTGTDSETFETIRNKVEQQYMYQNVWQFIKGDKSLTSDWSSFVTALGKRDYQTALNVRNKALGVS